MCKLWGLVGMLERKEAMVMLAYHSTSQKEQDSTEEKVQFSLQHGSWKNKYINYLHLTKKMDKINYVKYKFSTVGRKETQRNTKTENTYLVKVN